MGISENRGPGQGVFFFCGPFLLVPRVVGF